jgi:hypothetical protein
MLVCSAISLINSTMLPISCELSPSRLMRLLVSWMVSRIVFMPSIVRRTASPPLCAMSTEWRATSEQRSAFPETSSIEAAMSAIDSLAAPKSAATGAARLRHVRGRAWVCLVGAVQLDRAVVDRRDQLAQRLDRVVDRVGDRAGDVLGDGRLHRQIAVGEARQLVEQAHDGLLVALVLAHPQLDCGARSTALKYTQASAPSRPARAPAETKIHGL